MQLSDFFTATKTCPNHDITSLIHRLCIEGKNQKSKSQG